MPFPLIPVVIAGAVALVSTAVALFRPKLARLLDGKTVAILGGHQTGKTTLLNLLAASSTEAGTGSSSSSHPGKFTLTANGKKIEVEVPIDVSGSSRALYSEWKGAFERADYVWYLFRADLVYERDAEHVHRIIQHLDLLKSWTDSAGSKGPSVILIGTWSDRIDGFNQDAEKFAKVIRKLEPIRLGRRKFKRQAPVVVGSLFGAESRQLISDLEAELG